MSLYNKNQILVDQEPSGAQKILMAHQDLCSLTAVESMYRSTVRRKSFVEWFLKIAGLHDRGRLNYLSLELVSNKICINTLPDELTGLRILQLGNLHLCSDDELLERLKRTVDLVEYDLCILTGGVGFGDSSDYLIAEQTERLLVSRSENVFAVLGIGDTVRTSKVLQRIGITVLNNEFAKLKILNNEIEIFGVECRNALIDPRFEKRIRSFNGADLRILVAANPQLRVQSDRLEFDLMLTGAQNCKHCAYKASCRWRQMASQYPKVHHEWNVNGLEGFTSSGLGHHDFDVRFRSRPELVIHELVNNQYV